MLLLCLIILGTTLSHAEKISIYVTVHGNGICSDQDLVTLAGQPLDIEFKPSARLEHITNAHCTNKKDQSVSLNSQFQKLPTGVKLMVANLSAEMGPNWFCKFAIQGGLEKHCTLSVRYRNLNEAVLSINGREVGTNHTDPYVSYDGVGHYYFKDGDMLNVTCNSQSDVNYTMCTTELHYFTSKGKEIQPYVTEPHPNECEAATMQLQMGSNDDKSYLMCHANKYITKVILHLQWLPPTPHPEGHTTNTLPTHDPTFRPPEHVVTASPRITRAPTESTPSYKDTDPPAISPWVWVAIVCGVAGVVVLISWHVIRLIKDKKSRDDDITYENFPNSNDSPLPHPDQWNEPTYAVPSNQQPEPNLGPQSNLDMLYSKPNKDCKTRNIGNNVEYADIEGLKRVDRKEESNYSQVYDKNAGVNRLVDNDGPVYSEVSRRDTEYANVIENSRYINAQTTEYAEPAYCDIKNYKK